MTGVSKDIKDEILVKVKQGISVADLSNQYGISTKTIYNWLRSKAVGTVSTIEHAKLQRENTALKEIIGVLSLELSKFKKK